MVGRDSVLFSRHYHPALLAQSGSRLIDKARSRNRAFGRLRFSVVDSGLAGVLRPSDPRDPLRRSASCARGTSDREMVAISDLGYDFSGSPRGLAHSRYAKFVILG